MYRDGDFTRGLDTSNLEDRDRAPKTIKEYIEALRAMTDEQRVSIFAAFCTECGSTEPRCHCANDE